MWTVRKNRDKGCARRYRERKKIDETKSATKCKTEMGRAGGRKKKKERKRSRRCGKRGGCRVVHGDVGERERGGKRARVRYMPKCMKNLTEKKKCKTEMRKGEEEGERVGECRKKKSRRSGKRSGIRVRKNLEEGRVQDCAR